jgi:predicted secreted protein
LKKAVYDALEIIKPHVKPGEVDVETDSFNVSPKWTQPTKLKPAQLSGYTGRAELGLTGTDMRTISELAGKVTSMQVTDTTYGVSRTLREEIEGRVLDTAIQNFRTKARAVAKSFGFNAFKTVQVQVRPEYDGGRRAAPRAMALSVGASMETAAIPAETGKTDIGVTVSGTIQMVD